MKPADCVLIALAVGVGTGVLMLLAAALIDRDTRKKDDGEWPL